MDLRFIIAASAAGVMVGCGQSPAPDESPPPIATPVKNTSPVEAPVDETPVDEIAAVEPQEEILPLDGPGSSYGVLETIELGVLPLKHEGVGLQDRTMRVREITIEPGGVVAVHRNDQQPGVAYILEGELMEYRSDEGAPVKHGVGSVVFEENEIVHWWANESGVNARALLVEIVPE